MTYLIKVGRKGTSGGLICLNFHQKRSIRYIGLVTTSIIDLIILLSMMFMLFLSKQVIAVDIDSVEAKEQSLQTHQFTIEIKALKLFKCAHNNNM